MRQGNWDQVYPYVYDDMLRIASRLRKIYGDGEMGTHSLVHAAFTQLQKNNQFWNDRVHFFRHMTIIKRRTLITEYYKTNTLKRGRGMQWFSLEDLELADELEPEQFIILHEALKALSKTKPRWHDVVELQIFGGYTHEEIAETLCISTPTSKRDFAAAKRWLKMWIEDQTL